ncbi:hypothetical protein NJLHNGOC_02905 [Novacetimonas cocois]|uniref:Uncharacterized protein n=1 Tax=Novacetimonas cocois TaxID=1747507 RepID=A0A365Z0L4_9PROT|nr:hypothetical protein NJLHNGOC_02905 [Novacetimonas cocois]
MSWLRSCVPGSLPVARDRPVRGVPDWPCHAGFPASAFRHVRRADTVRPIPASRVHFPRITGGQARRTLAGMTAIVIPHAIGDVIVAHHLCAREKDRDASLHSMHGIHAASTPGPAMR